MEREEESGLVQAAHRHITLTVKGEKIWVQATPINISGTSIYNPYGKRERVRDTQIIRRVARPSQGQAETPPSVRDTQIIRRAARPSQGTSRDPTRRAETLTSGRQRPSLEGANQDIKESGHQSRRPPTHKGYNQFIKDARRSRRATQLSQLKPMEGKIWSLTQTCGMLTGVNPTNWEASLTKNRDP